MNPEAMRGAPARYRRAAAQWACLPLACALASAVCLAQSQAAAESLRALHRAEYGRAAALARQHLEKRPGDVKARVTLARAELAQGRFHEAYEQLRRAISADPRDVDALYYMAVAARALSDLEFRRLYALAPDSERVHLLMAQAAAASGNATEAEAELDAALAANPESVEALTALAELKRSQSKFDEAIELYRRAERAGGLDYDVAYGLGVCFTFKQDLDSAATYLRRAVGFSPGSGAARFALGNALVQAERFEEAIPELQGALARDPRLTQAHFLLGRAYQRLGRAAEARAAFQKLDEANRRAAAGTAAESAAPQQPSGGPAADRPAGARRRPAKRKP